MNFSVHAVMYTYFAATSFKSTRAAALALAPAVTTLQLSQFAVGTAVNAYAAYAWSTSGRGCAVHPTILHLGAAMYVAYGALFCQFFARRYLRPRTRKAAPAGEAPPTPESHDCFMPAGALAGARAEARARPAERAHNGARTRGETARRRVKLSD